MTGGNNTNGDNNTFFGALAGGDNTTGSNNLYWLYAKELGHYDETAIGANSVLSNNKFFSGRTNT